MRAETDGPPLVFWRKRADAPVPDGEKYMLYIRMFEVNTYNITRVELVIVKIA